MPHRARLQKYAILSILAAVVTIALKGAAYFLTDSVGLLSDALESLVNLAAAIFAFIVLGIAARPPDHDHEHGHEKVEYLSSGFEGALILLAAASIAFAAVNRLLNPTPLADLGVGLAVSVVASLVNLGVAVVLLRAGRRHSSITLEADAHHLLTDVWTSVGVIAGVGAVALTGWLWLDPVVALVVAANIVWTGYHLMRRSALGVMDTVLPDAERSVLVACLDRYLERGMTWHALRTRQAGAREFAEVHILVPGTWSVQQGHDLLEEIERDIRHALPALHIITHLEPVEDPVSWDDVLLDRVDVEIGVDEPVGTSAM